MLPVLLLLAACAPTGAPVPTTVPWTTVRTELSQEIQAPRGFVPLRAIIHLHSPWSHDACDNHMADTGEFDESCLQDLRKGLCDNAIDVAFLSDHPSVAAYQSYEDLLEMRGDDQPIVVDGSTVGNLITCPSGHQVRWLPGFEGNLMPVAMDRQAGSTSDDSDRIYDSMTADGVQESHAAGGIVLMSHTEGKTLDTLEMLQDAGLEGTELYNVHAMFSPTIRENSLGLQPYSWVADAAPFIDPNTKDEPDLLFLAVLEEEVPAVQRWDALLQRGPMVGTAGTDAHQNVIPAQLADGERGDSYRRVISWFTNILLAGGPDVASAKAALAAGRVYTAFEVLGTPEHFDFHLLDDQGKVHEMGSDAPAGRLVVSCPYLSPDSPRGSEDPDITVTVFRDGQPWQTGCGVYAADGPHVYRVRVDMVPWHLKPFLGDDPSPWMHSYPWIYSNAIRVGM